MAAHVDRVEGFAELFHHYYTALASDFDCHAQQTPEWEELMPNERKRFLAATRLALMEAGPPTVPDEQQSDSARYNAGSEGRECGC
jgi:hypothetical protein